MAKFDVHRMVGEPGYVIDCQSDILRHLNSRFVVPLRLPREAPLAGARLNPRLTVAGIDHILVTQFAAAVPARALSDPVTSLADQHDKIMAALDMLISGY